MGNLIFINIVKNSFAHGMQSVKSVKLFSLHITYNGRVRQMQLSRYVLLCSCSLSSILKHFYLHCDSLVPYRKIESFPKSLMFSKLKEIIVF